MTPFEQGLVDRTGVRDRVRFLNLEAGTRPRYEVRARSDGSILGSVVRRRSRSPATNAVGSRWFFRRAGVVDDPTCPFHGYETRLAAAAGLLEALEGRCLGWPPTREAGDVTEPRIRRDRPTQRPSKPVLLRRLDTALNTVQEAKDAVADRWGGPADPSDARHLDRIARDARQGLLMLRTMVEALPDGKRRE